VGKREGWGRGGGGQLGAAAYRGKGVGSGWLDSREIRVGM